MINKLSTKLIHQNPYFKYYQDKFTIDNSDDELDYYYCLTKGGAMAIPVLEDGRLVLVRQYRYVADKHSIEFPCGGVEGEELSSQTVRRELLEETGYSAKDFVKVGEFESASGRLKDLCSVYVTTDLRNIQEPESEITGSIEVLLRRVDEFEDMIKHGEIWDGYTLASWTIARDYVHGLLT